jgi:multidrug efflux pump subunit AcrA (membrane-fusion protein)
MHIPVSALFESGGATTVWIYNQVTQAVEPRAITPASILSDGKVIVAEGLKEGEIIVTAGVRSLQQGEKVKLLPPVSPTNVGSLL